MTEPDPQDPSQNYIQAAPVEKKKKWPWIVGVVAVVASGRVVYGSR